MESDHTVESSLILTLYGVYYKVNKPTQGEQKLVSLDYANTLIAEHRLMKEALEKIKFVYDLQTDYAGEVANETLKNITL